MYRAVAGRMGGRAIVDWRSSLAPLPSVVDNSSKPTDRSPLTGWLEADFIFTLDGREGGHWATGGGAVCRVRGDGVGEKR